MVKKNIQEPIKIKEFKILNKQVKIILDKSNFGVFMDDDAIITLEDSSGITTQILKGKAYPMGQEVVLIADIYFYKHQTTEEKKVLLVNPQVGLYGLLHSPYKGCLS